MHSLLPSSDYRERLLPLCSLSWDLLLLLFDDVERSLEELSFEELLLEELCLRGSSHSCRFDWLE